MFTLKYRSYEWYMSVNEVPGLGVDINEKEAAKYPITTKSNWQVRKSDGTIIRP